jgi:cell division protein FtsN
MQRAQLGQKHKLTISPRVPATKKRIKQQQQQQQQQQLLLQQQLQQQYQQQYQQQQPPLPPTPIKSSTTSVKFESDTNSHTSDYSIPSTDELKHNVIEQPDHKPPACLLAVDHVVKHEPIETIEEKYEIEPPAAQLPPTIMDE